MLLLARLQARNDKAAKARMFRGVSDRTDILEVRTEVAGSQDLAPQDRTDLMPDTNSITFVRVCDKYKYTIQIFWQQLLHAVSAI